MASASGSSPTPSNPGSGVSHSGPQPGRFPKQQPGKTKDKFGKKTTPQAPKPPQQSLLELAKQEKAWRSSHQPHPTREQESAFWKEWDAKHGHRPDYLLWKMCGFKHLPPGKRSPVPDLALHSLQRPEPRAINALAALVLRWLFQADNIHSPNAPKLLSKLHESIQNGSFQREKSLSSRWLSWIITGLEFANFKASQEPPTSSNNTDSATPVTITLKTSNQPEFWSALDSLLTEINPNWKLGSDWSLDWQQVELPPIPLPTRLLANWTLSLAQNRLLQASNLTAEKRFQWSFSLWRIAHSLREPHQTPRYHELELLFEIGSALRTLHRESEAARYLVLALHLMPQRAPAQLFHRAQVNSWFLTELGLELPSEFQVKLDELPFPGEPEHTEKGKQAQILFYDGADFFQRQLRQSLTEDEDWNALKQTGIPLHHPLAALTWIARRAQAYTLKKQNSLLEVACKLATRYQFVGTLSRLRVYHTPSFDVLLELAKQMRELQRKLPFWRDSEEWRLQQNHLRLALGNLNSRIEDEESLFLLHEVLLDRSETLKACLPSEWTAHSQHELAKQLDNNPKGFATIEHQRQVELWSIAVLLKENQALQHHAWLSWVTFGNEKTTQSSVILQTARSRKTFQDKQSDADLFSMLFGHLKTEADSLSLLRVATDSEANFLYLQEQLPKHLPNLRIEKVPSWEAAYRKR